MLCKHVLYYAPIFREKKFNHTRDVLDDCNTPSQQGSLKNLFGIRVIDIVDPITIDEF